MVDDGPAHWLDRHGVVDVPDRQFELFDWSLHHKELVLRASARRGAANFDILFTAVNSLSLPVSIDGLRIEVTGEASQAPGLLNFVVLDSRGVRVGEIIAAGWRAGWNSDEPRSHSPLRTPTAGAAFAARYEASLLLALQTLLPPGAVKVPQERQPAPDAWLTLPSGFRVALEAKAMPSLRRGQRLSLVVDQTVQRAKRIQETEHFDGLLLVLGTWSRKRWLADDEEQLERVAAERLLAAAPPFSAAATMWQPEEDLEKLQLALSALSAGR